MSDKIVYFANIQFRGLTRELLLTEGNDLKIICTVNAEYIVRANQDPAFRGFLSENYSTFDGQVPYLLARIMHRKRKFEKISGSDFIYDICRYAKSTDKKVFLLGGYIDSNSRAVHVLRERYQIEVEGFSPKHIPLPFEERVNQQIIDHISVFRPHFLLVGFGSGKQEEWLRENQDMLKSCGVKWAIGVGGTFEFVSGTFKRSPRFIQTIGLEWVYRICNNRKMFVRCLKVAPSFLFIMVRQLASTVFSKAQTDITK